MPAKSERQRRFFGAELRRARAGQKRKTKLPISELRKFASKKHRSPPGGIQAFTSLPHASSSTPTVPFGHTSLPSPVSVDKAPTPPADTKVSAGGPPSDIQKNDGSANRGNEPKNVRGGPLVGSKPAAVSEGQPTGVRMYENIPRRG